jgi:hypothetical protein
MAVPLVLFTTVKIHQIKAKIVDIFNNGCSISIQRTFEAIILKHALLFIQAF